MEAARLTSAKQAAPASVHRVLASPGRPLDGATRGFMEWRLGNPATRVSPLGGGLMIGAPDTPAEREADRLAHGALAPGAGQNARSHSFSHVRIHMDSLAAESAREVGALAYTVGHHIVFAAGRYAPATGAGKLLLAHELAHVGQQEHTHQLQRQIAPATTTTPPAPRQDFVFIMGQDPAGGGNPFYTMALRYYRSHLPGATFVANVRSLAELLTYVRTNVTAPIGNLYIVSHANEDGTLSFGLNAADADGHLNVQELRGAVMPAAGASSSLANVSAQIDSQTRVRIKGCDLGRTQEMIELIDQAFGGAGTVTAPSHEQVYGFDPTLARAEEDRVRAARIATFTTTLPTIPEVPAPIPRGLRGAELRTATADRRAAVAARRLVTQARDAAIAAERIRIAPEVTTAGELAGTYEALSGPMFQHPGTTLFTAAQLRPEVDSLYSHLNVTQRASLVRRLVAPDRRTAAVANRNGVFQQQGQRAYSHRPFTFRFREPANLSEANRLYSANFAANHFRARTLLPIRRAAVTGGTELTIEVEGRISAPGQPARDTSLTITEGPVLTSAAIISGGQAQMPNPARYDWRVARSHASTGFTTLTAVAERVVAYLHHGSLDASARDHFQRPESDSRFFATSTFAPPTPPPPTAGSTP